MGGAEASRAPNSSSSSATMGQPQAASSSKGLVVKAVIQAYTCVAIWMSISIAVILFNKVRGAWQWVVEVGDLRLELLSGPLGEGSG